MTYFSLCERSGYVYSSITSRPVMLGIAGTFDMRLHHLDVPPGPITIPPTPSTISARTQNANAWLAVCQDTASHLLLAVIVGNRLTLYSAMSGNWLFSIDWSGETVILTEAEHKNPYPFRDIQTALKFLNSLLMNYVTEVTESRSATTAPVSRIVGAR